MIWHANEVIIALLTFVSFLAAIEAGFRIGCRFGSGAYNEHTASHVNSLQNALLGLLALLMGFTFAMAISRYDVRKELVVAEANAIGTTYLRAQFLPQQQKNDISSLLQDYIKARLEFYNAGVAEERIAAANKKAQAIKNRLWKEAVTTAGKNPQSLPVSLFVQTLNEMIDDQEERQAAFENHVPESVTWLLLFISTVSMGFIGYMAGLTQKRQHMTTALFALLIAATLTIILDIDRPRRGLIEVSQASLVRLQTELKEH